MKNNKTRDKILDISRKLFAEKGFNNVGMREIAKEVGIAVSVLYYHFENKDYILNEIIFQTISMGLEFRSNLEDKRIYISNKEKIESIIDKFKEFWGDQLRIVLMESLKNNEEIPLYKIWNARQKNNLEKKLNLSKQDIIKEFFFYFIPIINYCIFSESFFEREDIDNNTGKQFFVELIEKLNDPNSKGIIDF